MPRPEAPGAIPAILAELGLLEALAGCRPVVAGTIPLDLHVAGSDLDVLCEARDLDALEARLRALYGARPDFALQRSVVGGVPTLIARLEARGVPVELFAQPRPVAEQHGWRHFVVEGRLLRLFGPPLRAAVRRRKERGIKTEPAFAACLGLGGDPYEALLELEGLTDAALVARFGPRVGRPDEPRDAAGPETAA